MSKQWILVGAIVAGLVVGGVTLARVGATIEGVEVGKRAPDFAAVNLVTGDSVTLHGTYDGAVTLVNIWATWCIPCRAEMPAIEELFREFGPLGFKVAAVSIDEGGTGPVLDFTRDLGLTFDILHDRNGTIERTFQTTGVPESFLLDRNGVIVRKIIGEHPWNSPANKKIVEQLIHGGSAPDPGGTASPAELERRPGA